MLQELKTQYVSNPRAKYWVLNTQYRPEKREGRRVGRLCNMHRSLQIILDDLISAVRQDILLE